MSKGMYLICLEREIRVWEYNGQDVKTVTMGEEFTTEPESVEEFWTWWRNSIGDESIGVIPDLCVLADEAGLDFAIPVRTAERTAWDEKSIKTSLYCMYPAQYLTLRLPDGRGVEIPAQPRCPRRELFLIAPGAIRFSRDVSKPHDNDPEPGNANAQAAHESPAQEMQPARDEGPGSAQRTRTQAMGLLKAFFVKEKQKSELN